MAQMTFQRHEKKYLLGEGQYMALMQALAPYMKQDEYGLHTICSLYYDTDDFAMLRRAEEKPAYKEKLRLRSYGVPAPDDTVYMELKKKLDGVTYKRRMGLPLHEAEAYLRHSIRPGGTGQVFGEIDWFMRQNRPAAQVMICYDRIALYGRENPALRLTMDSGIRWRDTALSLARGDEGTLLVPGLYMMEIKTAGAMPVWLTGILAGAQAYPVSFSKFNNVHRQLCARRLQQNGFALPAARPACFPAPARRTPTRKEAVQHAG